jgi:hypothetical protein
MAESEMNSLKDFLLSSLQCFLRFDERRTEPSQQQQQQQQQQQLSLIFFSF